ncbi:hypothetical protein LTR47_001216 [Exophiala xenobiotica]|nr:hypothetical protein LTR92_002827 [Exophiala xenobiotica]KAK5213261.1 hypothetical protein LTR41_000840 [Exophiala xenobiotica]KAK5230936.1 hypothetical protein LTR72_000116 [Exophiala xenobiotica]KAK5238123.1 hypothetical protein LTR47_001216 [Exophiala xenobiotica]KAK5252077.1 hypothetical protein LTS06_003377 [Exophiala xenobiotica]
MGSISETPLVEIPIIDISGYLAGDPEAKKKAASEFRSACENQGFLQVVGHSVPPDVQERFLSAIARFFALPLLEKTKVSQEKSKCYRGYERIGGQKLDELDTSATPDQKEGFSVRPERALGRFLQGPNQWPEDLPGFKEAYMEYFNSVHQLSKSVFRLMALSLDLPEDHFDAFASDPDGLCLCRSHHYPPTPPDMAGRTRGVGAHTDFGALTLLLQDDIGGLEVLHKRTGTWHHVPPVKGAYVCNIGDLMQRWTNDRYKSTMHRVISPLSGRDRYSCAFFNDGAMDTIIECLPTCIKPGETPFYEPLKVEKHIVERYVQSYGAGGTVLVAS